MEFVRQNKLAIVTMIALFAVVIVALLAIRSIHVRDMPSSDDYRSVPAPVEGAPTSEDPGTWIPDPDLLPKEEDAGIEMPEGWELVQPPEGSGENYSPQPLPPPVIFVDHAIDLDGYEPSIKYLDVYPELDHAIVTIALSKSAYQLFLDRAWLASGTEPTELQLSESVIANWFDLEGIHLRLIEAGMEPSRVSLAVYELVVIEELLT